MSTKKQALRWKAEKATQGEWWSDSCGNEGTYGSGDDCMDGFTSYAVYDENNRILLDTLNSTAACINEEYDGESHVAWDEVGQRNAEFVAAANPATVLALLDELEAAEKRIAELTDPDGNAIAWESTTSVYVKFITDERYQRLRPGYQKWYKPYRCSNCAAGITVKGE